MHEHDKGCDSLSEREEDNKLLCKDVAVEVVMIFDSNAIVQPWAVMVKSLYTMSTDGAVSASTSSNRLAIRTQLS